MRSLFALALLAIAGLAHAQTNPRVLIDTDRGPLLVELDQQRAPNTVTNFLTYVDAKTYDNTLFHRIARNFVVQGGGFKDDGSQVTRRAPIASERNNGLTNTPGTIAMALFNGTNGQPNTASASSDFFFNTGTNTTLDPNFTVFGRVVFGNQTLAALNTTTLYGGTETPLRMPLLKRAVRVAPGSFPVMELHGGGWYDPANSGRGFNIEVAAPVGTATGARLVVYWYDYFEGRQIWMNGVKAFQWGDSEVVIPVQITSGAQFGSAFLPGDVVSDPTFGTVTVRFTACDRATVNYSTQYGAGTMNLQRLTLSTRDVCAGQ